MLLNSKKNFIVLILLCSFLLINFQNNVDIKLGNEQFYVINTNEKIGVKFNQMLSHFKI